MSKAKTLTYAAQSTVLAAACAAAALPVIAHDSWLTADRHDGQLTAEINYGDTDRRQVPDLNRVVTLTLTSADGVVDLRDSLAPGQRDGAPVLNTKPFSAPAGALLSVSYDNGFWVESPNGNAEINSTRLMVPGGTSQHWTVKYGKLLLGPGAYSKILHSRLELVPLKDPYGLAHTGNLPVRVELNGKPLPGVKIAYGDGLTPVPDEKMPFATTGRDGVAEIPVRRRGAYLLTTDCEAPALRPELAEYDHLYASLTFDTSK